MVSHPGFVGPVRADRVRLSDEPDTAVAQTVAIMAAYIREDSAADSVRALASQLRGGSRSETVANIFNWLRAHVRFVQDSALASPLDKSWGIAEVLIRPVDMLRMRDKQGDCDDFTMLGGALLRASGVPVVVVTVAAHPDVPQQFTHVYLRAAGLGFDSSHGRYVGWEVPNRFNKILEWSIDNGMPIARGNLSGIGFTDSGDASSSWWQGTVSAAITNSFDILKARLGTPPPGTYIQTPGGVISTGGAVSPFGAGVPPPGTGLSVNANPAVTSGFGAVPTWVLLLLAAVFVVVLLKRK